ncbi:hypothetical protein PENTCL1PPCAC_18192 [Pristionchus entomophagus]|uniref:SET domain-containing protein n=1 Tax=Pristionchus entomophagus TaxID=358040 RepID=A0AAV5TPB1_9BILA|nr:hypothetical protein PENTCL1PPCAC_18192 [Pristionchus entomophagus]
MDFDYIPCTVASESIDDDLLECTMEGCDCDGECTAASFCPCILSSMDNYDEEGRLEDGRESDSSPLLECHDSCGCVASGCRNRRVQFGVKRRVEIRPSEGKGMGLFAVENIGRGEFVCEYAGEMISKEEVERRKAEEGGSRQHNYVLTVKEHCAGDTVHTWFIDPSRKGNIGRFCNHSCNPCLGVVVLRVGTTAPIVGLFALRYPRLSLKSQSSTSISNFRPISLTSSVYKVFEKILIKKITTFHISHSHNYFAHCEFFYRLPVLSSMVTFFYFNYS